MRGSRDSILFHEMAEKGMRDDMTVNTPRLLIRYTEENDWKSLIRIWTDFGHSEFAKYDVPHTTDELAVREKARQWAALSPGKEHMFFSVCLGGEMIGYADFHKTADGYELGYCFHSAYHGHGYAKESLSALMDRLSDGRRARFTAGTALKNVPSVRLLKSLGFAKIGEEQVSFYRDENGENTYFTGGIFACEKK